MILAAYEGGGSIIKNLTNEVCLGLNSWECLAVLYDSVM